MSDADRERVAASCPSSKFKDDRHEWHLIMHHEDAYPLMRSLLAKYALRQCTQCKLTVLLAEVEGGSFNESPRKTDSVIYAFYPQGAS